MHTTTDPAVRKAYTRSLRDLADYLDKHPAVPVPLYGTSILVILDDVEDGGRDQVDQVAAIMGTPVSQDGDDGNYRTHRVFGVIGYETVAISTSAHARYQAYSTYWDCVDPEATASTDA